MSRHDAVLFDDARVPHRKLADGLCARIVQALPVPWSDVPLGVCSVAWRWQGDDFFSCIRASYNPVGGWALTAGYYSVGSLLMLNMLIAMLTKTFEEVSKLETKLKVYIQTRLTYVFQYESPAPPPFYVLTLPYECWLAGMSGVALLSSKRKAAAPVELEGKEREVDDLAELIRVYVHDREDDPLSSDPLRDMDKTRTIAAMRETQLQQGEALEELKAQLTELSKLMQPATAHSPATAAVPPEPPPRSRSAQHLHPLAEAPARADAASSLSASATMVSAACEAPPPPLEVLQEPSTLPPPSALPTTALAEEVGSASLADFV